jgi:hypothetical protein
MPGLCLKVGQDHFLNFPPTLSIMISMPFVMLLVS